MRSFLTSRPLTPRWGWKVLVWTLLIGQVVGVCTDSHVTVRTMLMKSASLKVTIPYSMMMASDMTILSLKGIKFPIICDRDGDFSRAFGVLKLSDGNFGAARAVLFFG